MADLSLVIDACDSSDAAAAAGVAGMREDSDAVQPQAGLLRRLRHDGRAVRSIADADARHRSPAVY